MECPNQGVQRGKAPLPGARELALSIVEGVSPEFSLYYPLPGQSLSWPCRTIPSRGGAYQFPGEARGGPGWASTRGGATGSQLEPVEGKGDRGMVESGVRNAEGASRRRTFSARPRKTMNPGVKGVMPAQRQATEDTSNGGGPSSRTLVSRRRHRAFASPRHTPGLKVDRVGWRRGSHAGARTWLSPR